jgi:hypothetical protein
MPTHPHTVEIVHERPNFFFSFEEKTDLEVPICIRLRADAGSGQISAAYQSSFAIYYEHF